MLATSPHFFFGFTRTARSFVMSNSSSQFFSKPSQEEDEEDETSYTFKAVLPVASKSFNGPPSTGEEYLRTVRMQARKIPGVVVAKSQAPKIKSEGRTKRYQPYWPEPVLVQEAFVPNAEWQESFLVTFEELRKIFQSQIIHYPKSELKFPKPSDEIGWRQFLYGVLQERTNHISADRSNFNESREKTKNQSNSLEPRANGQLPYLSIVATLDQQRTLDLLQYLTQWIADTTISEVESRWIFALLLRVDKLLTADQISVLRSLSRKCALIRSHLTDPKDLQLASVNIFITIIAKYFGQSDLG